MRSLGILSVAVLVSCVEYELEGPGRVDVNRPDTDTVSDPPIDTEIPDTENNEPDPPNPDPPINTDPPTDVDPPSEHIDNCPDGATATLAAGVYVTSWDRTQIPGSIEAETGGWYHLYDYALSESGSSQPNESGYLRSPNGTNPDGQPHWGNCGSDWIQPDQDNSGPPPAGLRAYLGTFWLDEGTNAFTFYHYCPLYRAGQCGEFHNTGFGDGTCFTDNWNSVHFDGHGICIVLASP